VLAGTPTMQEIPPSNLNRVVTSLEHLATHLTLLASVDVVQVQPQRELVEGERRAAAEQDGEDLHPRARRAGR
jgi:hypothetical protein